MRNYQIQLALFIISFTSPLLGNDESSSVWYQNKRELVAAALNAAYPPSLNQYYQLYITKCTSCHGLDVTMDTSAVLPNDIHSLNVRMAELKGANISKTDIDNIDSFMIYDAAVRRRKELLAALKALPEAQQGPAKEKIKLVVERFKGK